MSKVQEIIKIMMEEHYWTPIGSKKDPVRIKMVDTKAAAIRIEKLFQKNYKRKIK